MGKFQTSVVGATSLLEVIWEMPSSRPCGEKVARARGPHSAPYTHAAGGLGRQAGFQGPYRCGNPVLAVDEAKLAVEVVKSRELWEREAAAVGNDWD